MKKLLRTEEFGKNGKMEDKTGKVFGKLKAIHPVRRKSRVHWFCECACGNNVIVNSFSLSSGVTKSCGCILKKLIISKNEALFKGYGELSGAAYGVIRYNAQKRNIPFSVTVKYAWELFLQQNEKCSLSGLSLSFGNKRDKIEQTASLDRIDSSKGYEKGNVQWVHKIINIMKGTNSQDDFVRICKLINNYNT